MSDLPTLDKLSVPRQIVANCVLKPDRTSYNQHSDGLYLQFAQETPALDKIKITGFTMVEMLIYYYKMNLRVTAEKEASKMMRETRKMGNTCH